MIAVDGDSVEADGLLGSVVESSAEVVLDGCYKLEKTRVGVVPLPRIQILISWCETDAFPISCRVVGDSTYVWPTEVMENTECVYFTSRYSLNASRTSI
jgi:hypothetical protein